jgi:hypothetical protein
VGRKLFPLKKKKTSMAQIKINYSAFVKELFF